MKVDNERLFVIFILIVIVILFVRLLFILTDKHRWQEYRHPSARFHDTTIRSSSCNDDRYMMVKQNMKYMKL
jgi:cell division inhibitor SulA